MLTLTDAAQKELEGFFADREKATVRIYLAPGGCSGPRLALALLPSASTMNFCSR